MNPSKTANPTTGVVEAGPYSCLTRKTKHFWHHKLVQTNTLLDSQTTNTHPSPQPQKRAMLTGGIRFNVHFSSCDSPCRRMSTLHRCVDPCNSKFIFVSPGSLPIRATVTVPCGSATWTTIHTSAPVRKTGRFAGPTTPRSRLGYGLRPASARVPTVPSGDRLHEFRGVIAHIAHGLADPVPGHTRRIHVSQRRIQQVGDIAAEHCRIDPVIDPVASEEDRHPMMDITEVSGRFHGQNRRRDQPAGIRLLPELEESGHEQGIIAGSAHHPRLLAVLGGLPFVIARDRQCTASAPDRLTEHRLVEHGLRSGVECLEPDLDVLGPRGDQAP